MTENTCGDERDLPGYENESLARGEASASAEPYQSTVTPNDYRARAASMEARGEVAYAAELRSYADKLALWPVSVPGERGASLRLKTWDDVEAYQRDRGWRAAGSVAP
jgi:hypothetical protein